MLVPWRKPKIALHAYNHSAGVRGATETGGLLGLPAGSPPPGSAREPVSREYGGKGQRKMLHVLLCVYTPRMHAPTPTHSHTHTHHTYIPHTHTTLNTHTPCTTHAHTTHMHTYIHTTHTLVTLISTTFTKHPFLVTCVIPSCSPKRWPLSVETTRSSSMSHLFPARITWALSQEYVLI